MASKHGELFPLVLTPFERYLISDDRPEYPMTALFEFELRGQVQEQLLEESLAAALVRHPLLTARISSVGRRLVWVENTSSPPRIRWLDEKTPLEFPGQQEFLDLRREPGLRIWFRRDRDRQRLSFQAHHACSDGVGALRFAGDWFALYRAAHESVEPKLPTIDTQMLVTRGRSRWKAPPEPVSRWKALSSQIRETIKWMRRRLAPLASSQNGDPANSWPGFPGLSASTLTESQTRSLRQLALKIGVSLNDFLLSELLLVVADWNRTHGDGGREEEWLQINVPTNLRDRSDKALPATNVLGYVFLARRRGDCVEDSGELLEGIRREMEIVHKWSLGNMFLDGLATVEKLPGGVSWFTRGSRCLATTVFTNVGDVTRRFGTRLPREDGHVRIGDMVLDRVVGSPPLRPETRAVFAGIMCAGCLTLTIRSDPTILSQTAAKELLDRFTRRLLTAISDPKPLANRAGQEP